MPKHQYFYTYADTLAAKIQKCRQERKDADLSYLRAKAINKEEAYFNALVEFYETLAKSSILRDQKNYAKRLIYQLEPSWAEGYFKPKRQKK